VVTAFIVNLDWHEVLSNTLVPTIRFSKDQLFLITAILGTTISPYLFFWQTSQEVEEKILDGKTTIKSRKGSTPEEIKRMRFDVWSGMFVSNLVMFCIIAVCAATLFRHGITNINSASDAAAALRPLVGERASLIFSLGIIGTGLLALPVLAGSASYALTESFGWKEGLYKRFKQAHAFYGIIILSMLTGLAFNFVHIDPIQALIYSAVANGLVAPIILIIIVLISSNKKIMGEWVNNPFIQVVGWVIAGLMTIAGIATIASLFF
jgi:Mn2+/Fe2+ NRAMP family transporter